MHSASWHKSCHLKYSKSKLKLSKANKGGHTFESDQAINGKRQAIAIDVCIFCDKGCEEGSLHQTLTFDADTNMCSTVTELHVVLVGSEVSFGVFKNRYRSHVRKTYHQMLDGDEILNESRAFMELTIYIERAVASGTLLF